MPHVGFVLVVKAEHVDVEAPTHGELETELIVWPGGAFIGVLARDPDVGIAHVAAGGIWPAGEDIERVIRVERSELDGRGMMPAHRFANLHLEWFCDLPDLVHDSVDLGRGLDMGAYPHAWLILLPAGRCSSPTTVRTAAASDAPNKHRNAES